MRHRGLAYLECGDPNGHPVVYCHGFPSSGREAWLLHPAALVAHARIIAPDRPGYGESDFRPGRTILDWAEDVAVLADRLGLGRFGVLGVSGGAPYALACTWRMPQRIDGCALVCPLGPVYLESLLAQMDWAARFNLKLARRIPRLSEILLAPLASRFLAAWPETLGRLRRINATEADLAELADPSIRRLLDQTVADALRNGARGARQDLSLLTSNWGIPLERIDLELDVWHGEADGVVPASHSRWYAARLRRARVHFLPGEGHYSLPLRHAGGILRRLLA